MATPRGPLPSAGLNRDSAAVRASVLDVAMQLGLGRNSTVAHWLFNPVPEEGEEDADAEDDGADESEKMHSPGLLSTTSTTSDESSLFALATPLVGGSPAVRDPFAANVTNSFFGSPEPYQQPWDRPPPLESLKRPQILIPGGLAAGPPSTATLTPASAGAPLKSGRLRKARKEGYESDGGYVSDSRAKKDKKVKKKEPEADATGGYASEGKKMKEKKVKKKKKERSGGGDGGDATDHETDGGYFSEAARRIRRTPKSPAPPVPGASTPAGDESDGGYLSEASAKMRKKMGFFRRRKDSAAAANGDDAARARERIPPVPPMLPQLTLPIAERFARSAPPTPGGAAGSASVASAPPLPRPDSQPDAASVSVSISTDADTSASMSMSLSVDVDEDGEGESLTSAFRDAMSVRTGRTSVSSSYLLLSKRRADGSLPPVQPHAYGFRDDSPAPSQAHSREASPGPSRSPSTAGGSHGHSFHEPYGVPVPTTPLRAKPPALALRPAPMLAPLASPSPASVHVTPSTPVGSSYSAGADADVEEDVVRQDQAFKTWRFPASPTRATATPPRRASPPATQRQPEPAPAPAPAPSPPASTSFAPVAMATSQREISRKTSNASLAVQSPVSPSNNDSRSASPSRFNTGMISSPLFGGESAGTGRSPFAAGMAAGPGLRVDVGASRSLASPKSPLPSSSPSALAGRFRSPSPAAVSASASDSGSGPASALPARSPSPLPALTPASAPATSSNAANATTRNMLGQYDIPPPSPPPTGPLPRVPAGMGPLTPSGLVAPSPDERASILPSPVSARPPGAGGAFRFPPVGGFARTGALPPAPPPPAAADMPALPTPVSAPAPAAVVPLRVSPSMGNLRSVAGVASASGNGIGNASRPQEGAGGVLRMQRSMGTIQRGRESPFQSQSGRGREAPFPAQSVLLREESEGLARKMSGRRPGAAEEWAGASVGAGAGGQRSADAVVDLSQRRAWGRAAALEPVRTGHAEAYGGRGPRSAPPVEAEGHERDSVGTLESRGYNSADGHLAPATGAYPRSPVESTIARADKRGFIDDDASFVEVDDADDDADADDTQSNADLQSMLSRFRDAHGVGETSVSAFDVLARAVGDAPPADPGFLGAGRESFYPDDDRSMYPDDDRSRFADEDGDADEEARYRYSVWSMKSRRSVLDTERSGEVRNRFVKRVEQMLEKEGRREVVPPVPRMPGIGVGARREWAAGTGMGRGERF